MNPKDLLRIYPRYKWVLVLLDAISLSSSSFLSLWLRHKSRIYGRYPLLPRTDLALLLLIAIGVVIFMKEKKLYKARYFMTLFEQARRIAECLVYGALFFIIFLLVLRRSSREIADQSVSMVIPFIGLSFYLLIIERLFFFREIFSTRWSDHLKRKVLIIGSDHLATVTADAIQGDESLPLEIVGFGDDEKYWGEETILGYPVWHGLEKLRDFPKIHTVDEIFIALNDAGYERILRVIELCKQAGVSVSVLSKHFHVLMKKMDAAEFQEFQSIVFSHLRYFSRSRIAKRIIDISVSIFLLTILSPVFFILAALIKFTSEGPVFFRCRVVGKDGKRFTLYKFRTMYQGDNLRIHKELIEKIISGQQKEWKKDAAALRITPIGKFLRRFSIDELPQLINVLRGEMSLVGPRQSLEYEYELLRDWQKRRFEVKPGMTGLWQVMGRNEVSCDDMVILDLFYRENWSLYLDLKILLKTIKVVALAKGGV